MLIEKVQEFGLCGNWSPWNYCRILLSVDNFAQQYWPLAALELNFSCARGKIVYETLTFPVSLLFTACCQSFGICTLELTLRMHVTVVLN